MVHGTDFRIVSLIGSREVALDCEKDIRGRFWRGGAPIVTDT
jgi:hypothetical protein